jgi:tetratricopeptide (TPR) repeat protein
VQTQAVTYIVQRMTSLATMFYLLSVVFYVRARLSFEARGKSQEARGPEDLGSSTFDLGPWTRRLVPVLLLAGSVFSAVLAMKTKEMAVTLPLAIVLYEALFFKGPWKRRLFYLLPILATLPIVPMSVLAPGVPTGNILSDVGDQLRAQSNMSRLDYLFTQFRVIVTYLRLLVLPVNQNLDYDYPVYMTFFTPPVFLSFLLLAALLAVAVWCYLVTLPASRLTHPASLPADPAVRLVSFGLLWFFLTLSVESSVIPIADVIFEHRLYLPSVGATAVFATGFFLVSRKISRARAGALSTLVAAFIIVCLGIATSQRNLVWGDEVGLWEDVVSKSPQKPRPYNNLGYALNKAGKPWDAIPNFMKALTFAPYYADANYNLGRAYLLVDQSAMAIPLLQKAIRIQPNLAGAYSDLGAALNLEGRYQEAATFLEQNLGRLSQMPAAHFNLGVADINLGNQVAARRELEILARLDPEMSSRLASLMRSSITK